MSGRRREIMRWKIAIVGLAMLFPTGSVEGAGPPAHLGDDGKLVYVPDEKGNVVPDYSHAGYGRGGVEIPLLPVRAVVEPGPGDDGGRIQAAVVQVSATDLDDNGHRGKLTAPLARPGLGQLPPHLQERRELHHHRLVDLSVEHQLMRGRPSSGTAEGTSSRLMSQRPVSMAVSIGGGVKRGPGHGPCGGFLPACITRMRSGQVERM